MIRECTVLRSVGTSEFFQPKDNMLEGLEVCNLVQWRRLQLHQCSLGGVWIHSFQDGFQTVNPACNRLQHLHHFLFYGYIADQLRLVDPPVPPQDVPVERSSDDFLHPQNALIKLVARIRRSEPFSLLAVLAVTVGRLTEN